MSTLFKKDIDPMCIYCAHGTALSQQQVACPKKGVQLSTNSCRRFRYDPLRRTPPRPRKADFSYINPDDFIL